MKLKPKKIKAWTGVEPMTSAIPVQCSTNYPTRSWPLCEFVIDPYKVKNASEYMKVHIFELRVNDIKIWLIIAVIHTTETAVKLKPEKIRAWTGFEPMISATPVQCSTNWAIKPSGSWPLCELVIYNNCHKLYCKNCTHNKIQTTTYLGKIQFLRVARSIGMCR